MLSAPGVAVPGGLDLGGQAEGRLGVVRWPLRAALTQHLGEAPVHHLHFAERPDHDVLRFQVAVDHPVGVRVPDRLTDRLEHGQRVHRGAGLEQGFEGVALDELHRQERPAVGEFADPVNGRDAGVLELAGDLRFVDEPHCRAGPRGVPLGQDLDGHLAVQGHVPGAVNHPHAAAADLVEQLVPGRRDGGSARRGRSFGTVGAAQGFIDHQSILAAAAASVNRRGRRFRRRRGGAAGGR